MDADARQQAEGLTLMGVALLDGRVDYECWQDRLDAQPLLVLPSPLDGVTAAEVHALWPDRSTRIAAAAVGPDGDRRRGIFAQLRIAHAVWRACQDAGKAESGGNK